jgi:hypothetical protein
VAAEILAAIRAEGRQAVEVGVQDEIGHGRWLLVSAASIAVG